MIELIFMSILFTTTAYYDDMTTDYWQPYKLIVIDDYRDFPGHDNEAVAGLVHTKEGRMPHMYLHVDRINEIDKCGYNVWKHELYHLMYDRFTLEDNWHIDNSSIRYNQLHRYCPI